MIDADGSRHGDIIFYLDQSKIKDNNFYDLYQKDTYQFKYALYTSIYLLQHLNTPWYVLPHPVISYLFFESMFIEKLTLMILTKSLCSKVMKHCL